ncbi:OmpA family protein [Porphyromonas sp. oral taxon 275]|uniref:OmpA family protein n=1 Tax=Porphyromonas sp. oral taxon 275 TaxID=712435 RepID=UPI001BA8AB60|nr:OmpA family protein [Porphyromonas sp. oral taxon 275]QUB42603.1 OmpA family protein [Porphyromonas sp. oral taxon 275]
MKSLKTKSLLLALTLLGAAGTELRAQSTDSVAQLQVSRVDSVITLTEDELVAGLRAIAEAWQARQQQVVPQQTELARVLKLQLLLNSLGLSAAQRPVQPVVAGAAPAQRVYYPDVYGYARRYQQPQQQYQDLTSGARIDRLERLLELSLLQRQAEQKVTTLPAAQARAARQTNDSLLYVLRQELGALRQEREALRQQPSQVQQQPQQQPTTTQIVMPAVPLQPAQPVQQPVMPLQPLQPAQPTSELSDALLVTYFKRQVFFAVGRSELLPEARLTLNEVYRFLSQDSQLRLFLTGFASPEGNAKRNASLAEQRSRAVFDYLVSCGVSRDRLVAVAGGVDRNTDLYGVARRVDIELKK